MKRERHRYCKFMSPPYSRRFGGRGLMKEGWTMIRILTAGALLSALLLADGTVPVAVAQRARMQRGDDISGEYVNRSNGKYCSVEARGRGIVFVNETDSPARLVYVRARRLDMGSD